MLSLNIQNDVLYFKDIKQEHLPYILNWYNKVDDYKFATGIDKTITLDMLYRKYAEVAICRNEFFVGIYTSIDGLMIGILKGRIEANGKNAVWISSIVIDTKYQNKGYGSLAINSLLGFLKVRRKIEDAYLAVIEENIQGRKFWEKLRFKELRRIDNYMELHDKRQNVIIMYKRV